jgi:hypothetical protein
MQVFEQQQGNQGCPNLNAQGVFTGTDEGFHLEVLLESFEKDLYLPAVFVDGGNGAGSEVEMVGQQDDSCWFFSSQTTTRRRRCGQRCSALGPVSLIS